MKLPYLLSGVTALACYFQVPGPRVACTLCYHTSKSENISSLGTYSNSGLQGPRTVGPGVDLVTWQWYLQGRLATVVWAGPGPCQTVRTGTYQLPWFKWLATASS